MWESSKDVLKRWAISLGVSLLLSYGGYRVYHAYSHFTWQNVLSDDGKVYAIPSFSK